MASVVITLVDDESGNARVEVGSDTSLSPAGSLTSAQTIAFAMLTAAMKQAVAVTKNQGLLELLKDTAHG